MGIWGGRNTFIFGGLCLEWGGVLEAFRYRGAEYNVCLLCPMCLCACDLPLLCFTLIVFCACDGIGGGGGEGGSLRLVVIGLGGLTLVCGDVCVGLSGWAGGVCTSGRCGGR